MANQAAFWREIILLAKGECETERLAPKDHPLRNQADDDPVLVTQLAHAGGHSFGGNVLLDDNLSHGPRCSSRPISLAVCP